MNDSVIYVYREKSNNVVFLEFPLSILNHSETNIYKYKVVISVCLDVWMSDHNPSNDLSQTFTRELGRTTGML